MTDFTERAAPRLDIAFLMLASGCLIAGICLGIYMGVKEDFQLVAVHTHINLLGWVSLALFGVIYRNYPRLAASRLARAHFWLAAPGALAFPFGLYLMQAHQIHVVMVVGSLLWLLGALVFFMAVAGLALSRSSPAPAMAAGE
jgi:cbb3-type cytochrome oxidase subunit 1